MGQIYLRVIQPIRLQNSSLYGEWLYYNRHYLCFWLGLCKNWSVHRHVCIVFSLEAGANNISVLVWLPSHRYYTMVRWKHSYCMVTLAKIQHTRDDEPTISCINEDYVLWNKRVCRKSPCTLEKNLFMLTSKIYGVLLYISLNFIRFLEVLIFF